MLDHYGHARTLRRASAPLIRSLGNVRCYHYLSMRPRETLSISHDTEHSFSDKSQKGCRGIDCASPGSGGCLRVPCELQTGQSRWLPYFDASWTVTSLQVMFYHSIIIMNKNGIRCETVHLVCATTLLQVVFETDRPLNFLPPGVVLHAPPPRSPDIRLRCVVFGV